MKSIATAGLLFTLVGCGGGGGSATTTPPATIKYPVTVSVTGLAAGASLVLSDNGTDSLTVTQNGTFTFATTLANGSAYSVTVTTPPTNATCSVAAGSGTIGANTTPIDASCIGPFQVGGTIYGLGAGLQVVLVDNGSDTKTISANGPFTFDTGIAPGGTYSVTVGTLPTGEQCSLQNSTGTATNSNVTNIAVNCVVPTMQLLAGALGGPGSADGPALSARFNFPLDVALDANGNLYITDTYNATLRKIDSTGNVTTVAGQAGRAGAVDGKGSAAQFNDPDFLTVDGAGTIYLTDGGANTVRKVTADGTVSTLAGTPYRPGYADGSGASASFTDPLGIHISPSGSLYVADQSRIRNVTTAGTVTTLYSGSLHFVDFFLESQTVLVATNVGAGFGNNSVNQIDLSAGTQTAIAGGLQNPTGIAQAPAGSVAAGTIYVADEFGDALYTIGAGNALTLFAGATGSSNYGSVDGVRAAARFYTPNGTAIDDSGNLYVADSDNNEIRKVTPEGVVSTIAGAVAQPGETDDTGAAARFTSPAAIEPDGSGNFYVAEQEEIRKVTPAGIVSHVMTGNLPSPLSFSQGFGVDSAGSMYGSINSTIVKITAAGTLTTVAGSNYSGYLDAVGTNAAFNAPAGVTFDTAGNLYVADTRNYLIRKIAPDGTVSTVAGQPGVSGLLDGSGAAAEFISPVAVIINSAGTLYVIDGNTLRSISSTGVVTTIAGAQAAGSADGAGTVARFYGPSGLAFGSDGSLYVADTLNHEIRKVTANGLVSTIVGSPTQAGVSLGALPAKLNAIHLGWSGKQRFVDLRCTLGLRVDGSRRRFDDTASSFAVFIYRAVRQFPAGPGHPALSGTRERTDTLC